MPAVGLELTLDYFQQMLSLHCLPFRHVGQCVIHHNK